MGEVTTADEHHCPLLGDMFQKLPPCDNSSTQDQPCFIHRAPPNIREGDPRSYEPQVLSIGPYHRGNPKLHAVEEHKWRYLHNLLRRKHRSDPKKALEECIQKVRPSEARARSYYSEGVHLTSDDFVRMMVLDGGFILELFLRFREGSRGGHDPILHVGWMALLIRRDLLKLENQIPFFILEDLFDVAVGADFRRGTPLRQLAFRYIMWGEAERQLTTQGQVHHLLHFYQFLLLPTSSDTSSACTHPTSDRSRDVHNATLRIYPLWYIVPRRHRGHWVPDVDEGHGNYVSSVPDEPISPVLTRPRNLNAKEDPILTIPFKRPLVTIPCAMELQEVGIEFKKKQANSFLDVKFHDGTLYMPPVSIDDHTNSIFRNLVALEQCCPHLGNHFTWYVTFLDCIVNTPKDVAILQRCGIVENMLGSEAEVAQLINQLGKDVCKYGGEHHLAKLFEEVNQYCGSKWHKYRAKLNHDYFSNPWSSISVVAASVLLVFTLLQVIYAVLSYRKQ